MTREELEEGRRVYEEMRHKLAAAEDSGSAMNDLPCAEAWAAWFFTHGRELLSLAEEARWRSVTEEPPPFDSLVLIAHPRPTGYLGRDGKWVAHGEYLDQHDYPTHWRPLPKGPER